MKLNARAKAAAIRPQETIKQAMAQLDRSGECILLPLRRDGTLIGTVTDGDIRRYVLKGGDLRRPVEEICNRHPVTVREGFDEAHVRELMLRRRIEQIPVLDPAGRLVDLLLWDQVFLKEKRRRSAPLRVPVVIMAGGQGSRLDPFTRIFPKPLVPLGDKPIIQVIMDRFVEQGARRFILTVNYKAEMLKLYFDGVKETRSYRIEFVTETHPTGTAGSLALLPRDVQGEFFLTNCDILIKADYDQILRHHREQGNDLTVVGSMQHVRVPYGVLELEATGQLSRIAEKPEYDLLANTGFYVLHRRIVKGLPQDRKFDMTELIARVRQEGGRVGVFPVTQGAWSDAGQWAEYFRNLPSAPADH